VSCAVSCFFLSHFFVCQYNRNIPDSKKVMLKAFLQIFIYIIAMFFFSCASRSAVRFEKYSELITTENYSDIINSLKKSPKLYGKTNEFLYYMDIGALYHYSEIYDSSNRYLLQAADIYDQLFTRSVTNEALSILTNDNIRPYRSKPFELTMLHQMIAFNFCALQSIEDALVETRKMQLYFNEWERKAGKDEEVYANDPMFHLVSSILYNAKGESSDAMISLFKSISAFNNGPVALPAELNDYAWNMFTVNNRDNDKSLLNLKAPLSDATNKPFNNETEIIVVLLGGRGPVLDETVWWGTYVRDGLLILHYRNPNGDTATVTWPAPPIPERELIKAENGEKTKSGTTFHLKIAVPSLKVIESATKTFSVKCSSHESSYQSMIINDFDSQMQHYLENTKKSTVTRTVIRAVLRTIAAEKAKKKLETDSPLANLLVNIGTDILTDQMENADTRNCFFLPKTVQIVRIPVNAGVQQSIDIAALDKNGAIIKNKKITGLTLEKNEKRFIFYTSLN